jgi:hypothetical protein
VRESDPIQRRNRGTISPRSVRSAAAGGEGRARARNDTKYFLSTLIIVITLFAVSSNE